MVSVAATSSVPNKLLDLSDFEDESAEVSNDVFFADVDFATEGMEVRSVAFSDIMNRILRSILRAMVNALYRWRTNHSKATKLKKVKKRIFYFLLMLFPPTSSVNYTENVGFRSY